MRLHWDSLRWGSGLFRRFLRTGDNADEKGTLIYALLIYTLRSLHRLLRGNTRHPGQERGAHSGRYEPGLDALPYRLCGTTWSPRAPAGGLPHGLVFLRISWFSDSPSRHRANRGDRPKNRAVSSIKNQHPTSNNRIAGGTVLRGLKT